MPPKLLASFKIKFLIGGVMNNLRNASDLMDRAEITLTSAMSGFDMDETVFRMSNEDLIITLRLATELVNEAQNELSGCERKASLICFY